jgi:hypothetical protein
MNTSPISLIRLVERTQYGTEVGKTLKEKYAQRRKYNSNIFLYDSGSRVSHLE